MPWHTTRSQMVGEQLYSANTRQNTAVPFYINDVEGRGVIVSIIIRHVWRPQLHYFTKMSASRERPQANSLRDK
jgi:hypothetical protein